MSKLTIPSTDRRPASITEAQQEVHRYASELKQARIDSDTAQIATTALRTPTLTPWSALSSPGVASLTSCQA